MQSYRISWLREEIHTFESNQNLPLVYLSSFHVIEFAQRVPTCRSSEEAGGFGYALDKLTLLHHKEGICEHSGLNQFCIHSRSILQACMRPLH